MRSLCLIISVIPAAAAGFDVPAVVLNRGRFPSHPPSASQPGRRQRQQRLHTPLGHTHTHRLVLHTWIHTRSERERVVLPQRGKKKKTSCFFPLHLLPFLKLKCSHVYKPTLALANPPPPPPSCYSQARQSSVGDVELLIGRAFISVSSIWGRGGLSGLFGASLWADIKGC